MEYIRENAKRAKIAYRKEIEKGKKIEKKIINPGGSVLFKKFSLKINLISLQFIDSVLHQLRFNYSREI